MEFVTYKAIRGFYGGKEEVNITVPKGIKFLFNDGSIGSGGLTIGHNNYMFLYHLLFWLNKKYNDRRWNLLYCSLKSLF